MSTSLVSQIERHGEKLIWACDECEEYFEKNRHAIPKD